ncbi:c6 zinc finger domain-containing protein [Alternaria rosae]|uniref:c6 zinc finger domain-containing protein n=1 Tax=Alternaria rosae TaxID=1187941 RepID=UPI001E8E67AE|nr:c6 zinc finger domain-containing protein [Alternaria rosae]KAH6858903.1 c6 zinc finger domain-containing protein [Alternaria rosae]
MASHSRSRLTCAACAKRKVKCSKTVPCDNCIRRGQKDTCGIGESHGDISSPTRSSDPRSCELDYLRQRVAQLESETCQRSPTNIRTPPGTLQPGTPSDRPADESADEPDDATVSRDTATVLEFLAWGRRKEPHCHTVASLEPADDVPIEVGSGIFDDLSQLSVLQLLLPSPQQVRRLVEYHHESLLWYHGSYFVPTFQAQLRDFYDRDNGIIERASTDLQWVALLFAILTASLVCAPDLQVQSWGFDKVERQKLSRRWYQAIFTCLNRADYTSNLKILSCQAIATGTVSAHLLGFSTKQSIHLATAVRIAQSLGIHRLGPDASGGVVANETGRRVWCQLCSQDWFSIPFSESYLVIPKYSTSIPPLNSHDKNLVAIDPDVPTTTSYSLFLRNIAIIMPQLQDGLVSCNTPYTRYETVLHWDARLRELATRGRPLFMANAPLDPSWPTWVPYARRALAITSSHKIIMIHRSFLLDSFINPAFAFTRRTCLAASKTIVKEYKALIEEDGPTLWIHQAFAVAASITLLLDVLHREINENESFEHRALVEDIVEILQRRPESMIAVRGVKLLKALLARASHESLSQRRRKRNRDGTPASNFDVSALVRDFCQTNNGDNYPLPRHGAASPSTTDQPPTYDSEATNPLATTFEQPQSTFPFSAPGLAGTNSFDDLLYLANYDFTLA